MADKITQQITDALTRVAADPAGLPLYASKSDPGLFPNAAQAKPAAQKCLTDDLIRVISTDSRGKTPRDLYALTEKGWEFLLAAVNPKQVLEDFVRVLEARQGEVGELLDTARRMATSLQGLKDAVARVLPGVSVGRIKEPNPPTPFPEREGGFCLAPPSLPGKGVGELGLLTEALSLAPTILAHLAEHTGATDCTLPELFRAVAQTRALTIGEFHDCLRQLCADGTITLPAWTGPLYALPEPQYALLIGHGIAYYASLRG